MGCLIYGARGTRIDIDDRLLAHLQALVVTKLRRGEPFLLSWEESPEAGTGRRSVWVSTNLELTFEFDGTDPIDLDRKLLDDLVLRSSSNQGLDLADDARGEPVESQAVTPVS